MTRRRLDESGAVLIGFALCCTLLLALSALVVDLGSMRVARERGRRAADLGALAAGERLGNPGDRDPEAACEAAIRTATANLREAGPLQMEGSGCAALGHQCEAEPTDVVARTDTYEIVIRYPIPDAELVVDDEPLRSHDGQLCERMRVRVEQRVDFAFAGVFGVDHDDVTVDSTVRGVVGFRNVRVPALHALRRFGCRAITVSGQGRMVVEAFDASHPGVIGADALGNTTGEAACSSNTNADGYVVFAQEFGGLPGIEAMGSTTTPGVIALVATKVGSSRDVCCVPTGVRPGPTASPIISRLPVDWLYNPPARPGIDRARADAMALVAKPVADLRAEGWVVYPQDGAGWSCAPTTSVVVDAERVVVDCPNLGPKSQASITLTGVDVVARGSISVGTQNGVRMPNARRVVLAGAEAGSGLANGGTLTVNDGAPVGQPPRSCADRRADVDRHGASVVVLGGAFTSTTASVTGLCETFVYLAGTDAPQQRTSGGTCALDLPCPIVTADRGQVSLLGQLDWRASNASSSAPDDADPFEDLALWTETSLPGEIKGQGTTITSGVFFLPNAPIAYTGQASQDVQLNAQFFAESFDMSGQGTLRLTPNPSDVVPVPVAMFHLIR